MNVKRKRLLFVNGHMKVGGGEKSLLDMLQHMDETRYDIDLLLIEGKGEYYDQIPSHVHIVYVDITAAYGPLLTTMIQNLQRWNICGIWFRITLLLTRLIGKRALKLAVPLFHLANYYDCAIAYRPGICADIVAHAVHAGEKMCWWHNGKCDYTSAQIAEIDLTWRYMDKVVSVSEGCKKLICCYFTIPEGKIVVIPNMIDIESIAKKAGDKNPYEDDADLRIVTVCRLSEEKHLENAIRVMEGIISDKRNKIIWYIIGDGPHREYLCQQIKNAHLEESVILLGQHVNPYPYVKFSNMYVNTSYQESQSISVLEAMSLCVPCVVTETIGTGGYCRDGENCIVATQSADSLAQAVQTMMMKDDINSIVVNAYTMVKRDFSPERILQIVTSIL